jgi:hypothetical protein
MRPYVSTEIIAREETESTMAHLRSVRRSTRTRILLVLLLLALTACSMGSAAWAAERIPTARIASVEAPSAISPNEDFTVLVAVDYSASYSTDVAILDAATGSVLACKGLIIPVGRNSFTFRLTSRDQPGLWKLTATVRVWWHEGWYANQNGTTFPFEITIMDSRNATLVVTSNTVPISVTIDGVSHEVSSKGLQLIAAEGLHTIETNSPLDVADGARAVFDHWSDGVRSLHREIYLTGRLDLSAIYLKEYLLTVKSDLSQALGSGWYPAGTNATFGVIDTVLTQNSSAGQITYKFSGWSGDSDSSSPLDHTIMDRQKTVLANWSETSTQSAKALLVQLASLMFLMCSMIFVGLGAVLRKRGRQGRYIGANKGKSVIGRSILVLILFAVLAHSSVISPVIGSEITQPETVAIGDATWYHWNQASSDTLLIWLGGGIVEQATYLINPYEFESYNTIYFMQDLSRYYDVLALKKGSLRYVDSILNRTVFRESYPGSNNYIREIRSWANEHGYTYAYIVGYSVGAMAAAKELVVGHPEDWTSPNGLIIITTKISEAISLKASAFRASLLLLYGDKVGPEFITSGETFFQNTVEDGWKEKFWFHKEFQVIPDVEHEVWTIRDTGEYDERAVQLIIRFIETTKSLQFETAKESVASAALNHSTQTASDTSHEVEVVAIDSPSKAMTGEAFATTAKIRYGLPTNSTVAVVTFDTETASIVSASQKRVSGNGEIQLVNTIVPGERARSAHFTLIPLVGTDGEWRVVPDGARDVTVQITDSLLITVVVGYPNVAVQFDNQTSQTGVGGDVSVNATRGEHGISVPPIIVFDDKSRAVFLQWNGTASSSNLHLLLSRDMRLLAIYRKQYYVNVTSSRGQASGAGWYDEDSLAQFRLTPLVMLDGGTHVFVEWTGDSSDSAPASSVLVNGPKNIQAVWMELNASEENTGLLELQVLFAISLAILLGSVVFVGISLRNIGMASTAAKPKHST